jgi:hypothetical protein
MRPLWQTRGSLHDAQHGLRHEALVGSRFLAGDAQITGQNCLTPSGYIPLMSSWEDHQEMIDDQYLMESIEEDQKLDNDEEDLKDEE